MLIITQDKRSIINMDNIITVTYGFIDDNDYVRLYAETLTENPYTLGDYPTIYAAEEVIRRIAKAHNDNYKVFEMPEKRFR